MAFALACGVVCRAHNVNQVASAIHGGLEQRGLSPLRVLNPLPSARRSNGYEPVFGVDLSGNGSTSV